MAQTAANGTRRTRMNEPIVPVSKDDVILWPDYDWCYRYELPEMQHKSDDYRVLPANSLEWLDWHSD